MANREGKKIRLLCLGGILLLTSMKTVSAYAQIDALVPTVPLSPNLSPLLTEDPQNEPVTTLSTDLLAPQRPYIFDPSGASISANSLNPETYSLTLGSPPVTTDTQIRDSSQTGHVSPYGAAAQRLGLQVPSDTAGSASNSGPSSGSFHSTLSIGNDNRQPGTENPFQSSWNTGSASDPGAGGSSWGTRQLTVNRLAQKQADALSAASGANGDLTANGSSNSQSTTPLASRSDRFRSLATSGPVGNSFATTSSRHGSLGGRSGSTDAESGAAQPPSGMLASTKTASAGGNGKSMDNTNSAKNTLAYFPQADYTQSPLGESPFSSIDGGGELHFLNPNIYAATSHGHSLSNGSRGDATDDSLRQAFVRSNHPADSSSRYGLTTHLGLAHPGNEGSATDSERSRLHRNSHLSTGLGDSLHP